MVDNTTLKTIVTQWSRICSTFFTSDILMGLDVGLIEQCHTRHLVGKALHVADLCSYVAWRCGYVDVWLCGYVVN